MTKSMSQPGRRFWGAFLAVFLTFTAIFAFGVPKKADAAQIFTVYLQAGHSPSSMGNGNIQGGVKESTLNEQLTKKTYEAIKSKGINVKLLNPISLDASLPSLIKTPPGERGQYAYYSPEPAMLTALTYPERFDSTVKEQGDLVLSLHHNSYPDSSIRGYEVYYANTVGGDYGRDETAAARSKQAANLIAQSLAQASFGIPPRAPVVRQNNSNNGITKNSPVPSVLLENGYMSNSSDMAAAKSSANQTKVAARLAEAVVQYKNSVWNPNTNVIIKSFTVTPVTAQKPAFKLNASFESNKDVASVKAAVWTVASDQKDTQWYPLAKDSSGNYVANVSTEDFGGKTGSYAFHLYVTDTNGGTECMAQAYEKPVDSSKDNDSPTAASIDVSVDSSNPQSATMMAKDVTDPSGVASVRFAVWSVEGGQDDLKWYSAKQDGSDWSAKMNTSELRGRAGSYIVHAYATDKAGNDGIVGAAVVALGIPNAGSDTAAPVMKGTFTPLLLEKNQLQVKVSNVEDASGVQNVRFAFWGAPDQSDLIWYNGTKSGSDWTANIDLSKHKGTQDRYTIHVYSMDSLGNDGIIHHADLNFGSDRHAPLADQVRASMITGAVNLATLTAENVRDSDSGVEIVRFAVWTQKDGQDDLVWYDAEPVKNSPNWDITITAKKHNNEAGPYEVHAYGWDKAGNMGLLGSTFFTFNSDDKTPPTAEGMTTNAIFYQTPRAQITVKNVTDDNIVTGVRIAVWSQANGTDDLKWYTAKKSGNDWTASFDWSEDFNTAGLYKLEAHAYDAAGNEALVASTEVEVAQDALGGMPIMGVTQATKAQLVNYMMEYGWDNTWYDMTVDQFAQIYLDVCAAENVRAEVAFAQMIHETGGLNYGNLVDRDQYNYAGLGASGNHTSVDKQKKHHRYTEDGRDKGIVFKTVEDGIKSHVQHLKSYASKDPLVLPMAEEYDRYDFITHGCAPTVEALSGKWATSEAYSLKILLFVEGILNESTEMPTIPPYTPTPKPTPSAAGTPAPKSVTLVEVHDE